MKRNWLLLLSIPFLGCLPFPSGDGGSGGGGGERDVEYSDIEGAGDSGDFDDIESVGRVWEWVEIQGSYCGNGKTAGIGLSEGTDPSQILFIFAGGGACWDGTSCYIFNAATNIEVNYGERQFKQEIQGINASGFVGLEGGLFTDATLVYVPYCTADLHAGDHVGSYDVFNPQRKVHHKGAVNVEAYLGYISAAYPEIAEVFVVGLSAGGYGAMLNYHRFRDVFGERPVHILADGAPMIHARDGRWGMWKSAWKLEFPEGCENCEDSLPEFAAYVVSEHQDSRFGLLTWDEDGVIALYFSYQYGLREAIRELVDEVYPGEPGSQASAFLKSGTDHVMFSHYPMLEDDAGERLDNYVRAWVNGD